MFGGSHVSCLRRVNTITNGKEDGKMERITFRRPFVFLLFAMITLALVSTADTGLSANEGGAIGPVEKPEVSFSPSSGIITLSSSSVKYYNIDLQTLVKTHGSEIAGLSTGQYAVWRFMVHTFIDVVGHVNPEAFTITAVDVGRSGERIQIGISKVGSAGVGVVYRVATSPGAATYGLTVKDGDTIQVTVAYPYGFLSGYTSSAYVLQWALQNTGWIVP
jgi:hypothetical protein